MDYAPECTDNVPRHLTTMLAARGYDAHAVYCNQRYNLAPTPRELAIALGLAPWPDTDVAARAATLARSHWRLRVAPAGPGHGPVASRRYTMALFVDFAAQQLDAAGNVKASVARHGTAASLEHVYVNVNPLQARVALAQRELEAAAAKDIGGGDAVVECDIIALHRLPWSAQAPSMTERAARAMCSRALRVQLFSVHQFAHLDIASHVLVPRHTRVAVPPPREPLANYLPILMDDPMARYLALWRGELVHIARDTPQRGPHDQYRVASRASGGLHEFKPPLAKRSRTAGGQDARPNDDDDSSDSLDALVDDALDENDNGNDDDDDDDAAGGGNNE